MKLSDKILNLRKQQGMSQDELAEKLNVSRQAISRWEVGSAQPDASNILQISKLFGVTTDYLLNDEFECDEDIPVVHRTNQELSDRYRNKIRVIVGVCISGFSVCALLIIGILSSVLPSTYVEAPHGVEWVRAYTGLAGFLKTHNLEWLFVLIIALFIGGVGAIFYPRIQPGIKCVQEKFQKKKKADND